jgi:hypothetical protein
MAIQVATNAPIIMFGACCAFMRSAPQSVQWRLVQLLPFCWNDVCECFNYQCRQYLHYTRHRRHSFVNTSNVSCVFCLVYKMKVDL